MTPLNSPPTGGQQNVPTTSRRRGVVLVLAAATLWSTSGLFAKASIFATWPASERGLILAFWRVLFAGLIVLPLVRRPSWSLGIAPMTISFALMNASFLTAMSLTTAANAIWLQSTAPLWVALCSLFLLGESAHRRNLIPVGIALIGIGVILYFELGGQGRIGILCGLASGVTYGAVIIFLRTLRAHDAAWLVALNHLVAAVCLLPPLIWIGIWPTSTQLALLIAFGFFQMGLPYVLFARGLRILPSQDAALIALLEPLLVPLWAFAVATETPAPWTIAGAAFILTALLVRLGLAGRLRRPVDRRARDRERSAQPDREQNNG